MTNESKSIQIYEKCGIKFQYIPLSGITQEGENTTTLRAIKGVCSYSMTIRNDTIGDLLPIAKNDIAMFNRVIIGYLSGTLKCNERIEFYEEESIIIHISLDVIGSIYNVKLILKHESVDKLIIMQRKIDYLTEKVEKYEKMTTLYLSIHIDYLIVYNIETDYVRQLVQKNVYEDCGNNVRRLTKMGQELVESKSEGFIKGISNYDLYRLVKERSKFYNEYMKKVEANQALMNDMWQHSFFGIMKLLGEEMSTGKMTCFRLELSLIIINHMGYEPVKMGRSCGDHTLYNITTIDAMPTKIDYKYIFDITYGYNTIPEKDTWYIMGHDGIQIFSIKKVQTK